MRLLHSLLAGWYRVTAFARRRRIERDIDAEIDFHLAMRQAERARAGAPPEAAGRAARQRGPTGAKASPRPVPPPSG